MEEGKLALRRDYIDSIRRKFKSALKPSLQSVKSFPQNLPKIHQSIQLSFEDLYRLGQKIGQGTHGVVKRAIEIETGRMVAVKIIRIDDQKVVTAKENFLVSRLAVHPSIVKHHQLIINRKAQEVYIVMEYCKYPSLQSVYRDIKSRSEVMHVVRCLLEAVCELHVMGVCHRDLKPQNILYDRETGCIKIIDLGISKLLYNLKTNSKQKMWTVTGTLHYKAPQMLKGQEYDQLIDAWAIGVIAFQLAYSRLPFTSEFQMDLVSQIVRKQPDFNKPQTAEDQILMNFIQGLLRKNPQCRMNCFQALRHPIIERSKEIQLKFKSTDLSYIDLFSSDLRRSRSRSVDCCPVSNVEGGKDRVIKELRNNLIQECPANW